MADFLTNIWVQRIGFALGGLVLGLLVEKLIVKRAIPFVSAGLDQGESMTISCNLPRCLSVALLLLTLATSTYVVALEGQSGSPPSQPPANWGPISINLEDVPYPHPVRFMERTLYGQNVRIAYMDVAPVGPPNGRTVVLLHGGSYYGWYWEETIEVLRNVGFRVVVKDRLGWGRSSKPILPYSMNLHASNTYALLESLDISEAAVVGHSMGGQMASRFAFLYPEVTTHLVMVNAIGLTDSRSGRGWREPVGGSAMPDLQRVYQSNLALEQRRVVDWKPEFLEHVRIRYGMYLSGEWPRLSLVRAMANNARSIDTVVHDWPQIETKALVIGGAEDGPDFPERARAAADALQNGQLILIPNVGHNPHLEAPEIFNAELIRFLGSGSSTSGIQR